MGFSSRSFSMLRYRVKGEPEGSFWDAVDTGIKKGAFKQIESDGDIIAMGWVSLEDFDDAQFAGASYHRANYVTMSLRVDSVRVPPRIVELEIRRDAKKLMERTGQNRLSSRQRRDLKDQVTDRLRKQMFPNIQTYDIIWDTAAGALYFGSLATKARERFQDHFKRCFGLSLTPLIPYLLAREFLADESGARALDELTPSYFV
jgi:DNA recombination-dependent growth factor C